MQIPKIGSWPRSCFDAPDRISGLLGIPGAVADKEGIGFAGKDLVCGDIVGEDVEVAPRFWQARDHVLLDAEVDDGDPFSLSRDMVGCLAGDFGDGDDIGDLGGSAGKADGIIAVVASDNKGGTHGPVDPGGDGEGTGVDTGHAKKVMSLQKRI